MCKDNNLYKVSQDKTDSLVSGKYQASRLVLYFGRPRGQQCLLSGSQSINHITQCNLITVLTF